MAKVTSKLQLTLPKALADQYKIGPGDELDLQPAGETIRVTKRAALKRPAPDSIKEKLRIFEEATARQLKREAESGRTSPSKLSDSTDRGWTREELYNRGVETSSTNFTTARSG